MTADLLWGILTGFAVLGLAYVFVGLVVTTGNRYLWWQKRDKLDELRREAGEGEG